MTSLTIKTKDIERLLKEGKLKREIIGDTETDRVYWDIEMYGEMRRYYYHKAKSNPRFYIRED